MSLRLRIHTGALAGRGFEFARGPVRVGRNPGLELTFDPELDVGVSGLHAEFVEAGGVWRVRDLESRNGTFVNGVSVMTLPGGQTELDDGDVVVFGAGGPEVEVGLGGTLERIRAAAGKQTRRLQVGLVVLSAGLLVALVGFVITNRTREAGFEAERAQLVAETDSLLSSVRAGTQGTVPVAPPSPDPEPPRSDVSGAGMAQAPPATDPGQEVRAAGDVAALSDALRRSEAELVEIRAALGRNAGEGGSGVGRTDVSNEELRSQLQTATAALRRQQMAGSIDLDAIEARNRAAVALVFVESTSGEVTTGTAFAVRPDGTLLTVRHLVAPDADASPPRRIGVQFSDSDQVWPARLLAVSDEFDLAAIRVQNVLGDVPVVRGINARPDTLGSGIPVASLGFPLGGQEGTGRARPLATVGVLSNLRPDRIEVYGYGEVGASGSPLFDRSGEVVGVLFGGRIDGAEQLLLAVNSVQALRFLARVPVSP